MKAYLVIHDSYGYEGEYGKFEVDSVFLNKEKAEAYVERNNQIPFRSCAKFYIEEVEFVLRKIKSSGIFRSFGSSVKIWKN